ncbi:MAG: fibronectin type III domain-containing protein [Acutalibacteraceae bacterium]
MKKTAKFLVLFLFSLTMIFAMCTHAFAVGTVSKPKATATYNSVTLSWSKVSGADGYEVYVLSGKTWKKLTTTSSTSYSHKSLKINTTYKYRVRAYDKKLLGKIEYGSYSPTVSAKTSLAKVTGLKVASVTPSSVKLSWTKVSGATGYKLYVYSNKKWVYIGKTTSTSIKPSGIKPNSTYKYAVSAYRTVSSKTYEGAKSSSVTAKTTIAKVTGLKVASATATSIKLSWTKVSGATGYKLYVYSNKQWVYKGKTTTNSISPSGVKLGTTYKYAVSAYVTVSNKTYEGSKSSSVSAKCVLSAPTTVKLTTATTTSATVTWKAVSGATGYEVYLKVGSSYVRKATVTSATYTFTGLSAGTSYSIRIRAYSKNGPTYSSYVSYSFKTAPDKVTGLSADIQGTYATIKWNKATGAAGYLLYRYDSVQKSWVKVIDTTATSYKATGLSPNTAYTYLVKAYNTTGTVTIKGANSDSLKFTTYFADFTSFTVSETTSTALYKFDWTEVSKGTDEDATIFYEFEYFNYATNQWEALHKDRFYNSHDYQVPKSNCFTANVSYSGYATTVTFDKQPSATQYIVQVRSSSSSWINQATVTEGSLKTYLAPSTDYDIRVVANNGQYRVRACKEVGESIKYTKYLYLSNVPGTCSNIIETTTPDAEFVSTSNESKTVYTLKLIEAINNTKSDSGKFTLQRDINLNAELGKCTLNGLDITFLIPSDLKKELLEAFNEDESRTFNFENGIASYTYTDSSGKTLTGNMVPNSAIAPTKRSAYLYNQDDVANFGKKITSISVTKNADGTTSYKLVLAQETSKNGSATPVHDGFMDSFAEEFANSEEFGSTDLTVGATTITATVSSDNKLNSMTISSPFSISMTANMDGESLVMPFSGTSVYKYVITR